MKVIRYAVAWLMLLPVVLAGSDTVGDVADDRIVTIPHLREGDIYVYDLVLSSHARDIDLYVQDAFSVEVGSIRDLTLRTGEKARVLPVTYGQDWIPGVEGIGQSTIRWPLDDSWRGSSQQVDMIDVETGLVVERSTRVVEEHYEPSDDGVSRWRQEEISIQSGLERAQSFPYPLRPGEPIRSAADRFMGHLADAFGIGSTNRIDGVVDGTFVTRIEPQVERPSEPVPVQDVRCFLWLPEINYMDPNISDVTGNRPMDVERERETWVSGAHALPVLQECHVRLTDPQDDALIEDVRLATVLSSYEPGGTTIDIDMPGGGRATTKGAHSARAIDVPAPGFLDTRGAGLEYPLEDAVSDLHALTGDPNVRAWVADSSGTWYIRSATYTPRPSDAPADSTVPGLLPALPVEPPPYVEPEYSEFGWKLSVYDTGAGGLIVDVWRHIDANDRVVETGISGTRLGGPSQYSAPNGPAEPAIPLHELLALYGADAAIDDPLAWVDGPDGGFTIESDNLGSTHHRIGFPQTPRMHNHRTEGFQYRTSDGLLVDHWQRSRTSETVPAIPPTNNAAVQDAGSLIPEVRSPYAAAAGVGLLTVLTLLAYFWDVILRILINAFGFPLYAKVSKDKALDNPRREEIHALVQAEPGLRVTEIRKRLALGHGTTMFHLATLEHVGLLSSIRVGRSRQWFASGQMDHSVREQTAVLRHAAVKRVHDAIVSNPGIHQRALADTLGIRPASLRPHLARLESVGLVTASTDGQTKRYHVSPPPTERSDRVWRPVETAA